MQSTFNRASALHDIKGFPRRSRRFLPGIPLEPPRAGKIPIIFVLIIKREKTLLRH
jgi:hypothetical protein